MSKKAIVITLIIVIIVVMGLLLVKSVEYMLDNNINKNMREDVFEDSILDSDYIQMSYDLKEDYTEILTLVDKENSKYDLKRRFIITGTDKYIEDETIKFEAIISTINNVNKPNRVEIGLELGADGLEGHEEEVLKEIQKIISNLLNEEMADKIIRGVTQDIDGLDVEKIVNNDEIRYAIDFSEKYDYIKLSDYKYSDKLTHLYPDFGIFGNSIKGDGVTSAVGSLYGEYDRCQIVEIFNHSGIEESTSSISIDVEIDSSIVTLQLMVMNDMEDGGKCKLIMLETSTAYHNNVEDVLKSAEKIISGVYNLGINLAEEGSGINMSEEYEFGGTDMELNIKVVIGEDQEGMYGTIGVEGTPR